MRRELIESDGLLKIGMLVGAFSGEIETPNGRVVVRQSNRHGTNGVYALHTIVPGYLISKTPDKDGICKMEVETVPKEQYADVTQILNKMGYKEPISFWQ